MRKPKDDWQKNPPAPRLKPQWPSNDAAKRHEDEQDDPTHFVCFEKEGYFIPIGAGWVQKVAQFQFGRYNCTEYIRVRIDSIPINFDGNLVLLTVEG